MSPKSRLTKMVTTWALLCFSKAKLNSCVKDVTLAPYSTCGRPRENAEVTKQSPSEALGDVSAAYQQGDECRGVLPLDERVDFEDLDEDHDRPARHLYHPSHHATHSKGQRQPLCVYLFLTWVCATLVLCVHFVLRVS